MTVRLRNAETRENLEGRITEIAPLSNPATHSIQFKVDLPPDAAMPNGQFIKVEIPVGTRNVILVPRQAVRETGQLTGLFVVDSASKARFRLVKTVPYDAESSEVLSGIEPGEKILARLNNRDHRWDHRGDEAMSKPQMAGRLAHAFIHSKLTPLILVASISLGVAAVVMLPREEEPQIIVPMIDVMVSFPGASAKEVETRITKPMERLLWEIPGVEYVYTTSSPGSSMAIVRFYVGEDEEKSIVRLNQKMFANFDLIPPGASQPLIKPRSIDDVPFLALTLWSKELDGFQIRRAAAELRNELQQIPDISATQLIGGQRRTMLVEPDPARLAAYGISTSRLQNVLQMENRETHAGMMTQGQ